MNMKTLQMIKYLFLIIVIHYLFMNCDCALPPGQVTEQTLINTLLTGYNKNIRPDEQVSVDITASLQQIVSIDDKQQVMTSSSFITQIWVDERLQWSPAAYNDTVVVMLPVKSIWIPDTFVLNSADTNGYLTINDYSLASVNYDGSVAMILPALTIRTRCSLLAQNFPFDRQICGINLTSWAQGENRILYTENDSLVIDTSGYTEHPLWELTKTDLIVYRAEDRAPFELTYNNVISIQLHLRRKPSYFILNGIFACLVLNCVTLIAFTLPFATQISLCKFGYTREEILSLVISGMICFMTYSVYSLSFSSLFPQQSQYIMMITLFFLLSIAWTLVSLAWFVLYNHYVTKGEVPKKLGWFCERLQGILSCRCRSAKSNDNQVKKNDPESVSVNVQNMERTDI